MLQGDEVRACWQPPARSEPLEGLFRDLRAGAAVIATSGASQADTRTPKVLMGDAAGTRAWAANGGWQRDGRTDDTGASLVGRVSGLRDATHVPPRTLTSAQPRSAGGPGSVDVEGLGVGQLPTIRQRDTHGDQAATGHRVLDDPNP